jgi:hypothetical protein
MDLFVSVEVLIAVVAAVELQLSVAVLACRAPRRREDCDVDVDADVDVGVMDSRGRMFPDDHWRFVIVEAAASARQMLRQVQILVRVIGACRTE